MGSSFGSAFRITTFGESHGGGVGVIIDGCPAGIEIDLAQVQHWLDRRRPGTSPLTSPRQELDRVECLSGLEDKITLGTPIALLIRNQDAKVGDYSSLANVYRPSHADFTTEKKYGIRARSGGGRASARETIGRVAAAGIAEQVLAHLHPSMKVLAWVDSVKNLSAKAVDYSKLTRDLLDIHPLRCPDSIVRQDMEKLILSAKQAGDSVGGTIRCAITGVPAGLGEPVFDKLEADLAKAMLSLPATKGFEVGLGFAACSLFGSEHNDAFIPGTNGTVRTSTNNSGGIQGGISNGEDILIRVAFKPVATIFKEQQTVDAKGNPVTFKPEAGRHDPCVLPRAVPMVEAMATLVIIDHYLRQSTNEALAFNRKNNKPKT
jgi:chorismate synthase